MRKRIILEGPDGCSKTTIAYHLSKMISIPHYQSPHRHLINDKDVTLFNILKYGIHEQLYLAELCDVSVIYDRFFPSEYVYARVYHRETDFDLIERYDKWWNRMNGIMIFLDKPNLDKVDHLVMPEMYQNIRHEYENYKLFTSCKHITIDTSDQDLDKQLLTIISFLKE